MSRSLLYSTVAAASIAILVPNAPVSAEADCVAGEYQADAAGNPLCWPNGAVPICFNPALDPALDVVGGAGLRWAAFQQAVADWNAALAAVGSGVTIEARMSTDCWAIVQTDSLCADPDRDGHRVNDYAWILDLTNDASTGKPGPVPPGWVKDPAFQAEGSQIPMEVDVDALAWTLTQSAGGMITRGDINWLTHMKTLLGCPSIPWNYDHTKMPGTFAGQYDFYSVMLHELGHFLGLGHAGAGETGVMAPSIATNTRRSITDEERECLRKCVAQPVPVEAATWGKVRVMFR